MAVMCHAIPSVPTICRGYHFEPSGLSAFIFIIHLREPSVIVRRQILCRNSSDVMLGTIQYFRVTAVSGCLADVLRADVNPLFMSIPWERIYFYLRLKSGSANAEATVLQPEGESTAAGPPTHKDTGLSCLSIPSPSWS